MHSTFSALSLDRFRGIDGLHLDFSWKSQIIGLNGSGKTHILDALHLLAWGKLLYGSSSLEEWSRIEGIFGDDMRRSSHVFTRQNGKDAFLVQGKKLSKVGYLREIPFLTVYISPFDMNLLYFAPDMRRSYIDDILARSYEQFSLLKRDYDRTMKQRNMLLKRLREGLWQRTELDFWDKKFSELAYQYGLYRTRYFSYVQGKMQEYPIFFGKYTVNMQYQGDWIFSDDPEAFVLEYLLKNRERDILSGHTHIGPHRDDFLLAMGDTGESVQFYLSRWEMKMLLLGLKIIEANFLEKNTDKSIVLLIDDIFAELDDANGEKFLNITTQHQMILTSQRLLRDEDSRENFSCINLAFL